MAPKPTTFTGNCCGVEVKPLETCVSTQNSKGFTSTSHKFHQTNTMAPKPTTSTGNCCEVEVKPLEICVDTLNTNLTRQTRWHQSQLPSRENVCFFCFLHFVFSILAFFLSVRSI